MDKRELQIIVDGGVVYEQVYFSELKPTAPYYVECPKLDKGRRNVLPKWANTHPLPDETVVWTIYNKYEFDRGYNPNLIRVTHNSGKIPPVLGGLINSRESDWF